MDTTHLLLCLPPLLLAFYSITQHLTHKLLNHPPTPFPNLPIVGHLYFFTNTIPFHRALARVSRRHGPIVFLQLGSRPALLVSSPSSARDCLASNDVAFANRPDLLNGRHFGYGFTSLAWAPYGDHWRNLRRISALELLSFRRLNESSRTRDEESRALIAKLTRDDRGPTEGPDLRALFFEYAYGVVTRMITGDLLITDGEESSEAGIFMGILKEMTEVTFEANVVDFLPFVGWLGFGFSVENKLRVLQEKRERFMENLIKKYRRREGRAEDGGYKPRSLIRFLLDLQRAEPEYYTDEAIRNLLLVLIQGASHTSSTTLEWALSHLLQNPDILKRARADINTLVGQHRLVTEPDLSRLPYLQSIISETLRMHPAAPLLTPHVSSEECVVGGGFRVPRGTILLVNAWDIQNDSRSWDDPEKFMPKRFEGILEGGKNEFKYFPFGRGRRACPGESLAMRMVGLALGSLIQCFEWERIGEVDMREGKGVVTPMAQPLRAKCVPRPFVANLVS